MPADNGYYTGMAASQLLNLVSAQDFKIFVTHTQQQRQAERQAMRWRAKLSSDLVTEQQRRDFAKWLAAAPEHAAAWRSVNGFWAGLDDLDWAGIDVDPARQNAALGRRRRLRFQAALGLAASLLLLIGIGVWQIDFYLADFQSAVGRQQQLALADGSTVMLNTDSALSVDFSDRQRRMTLHRGEAYFKVAPDGKRPFIVATKSGQIQALGTAFAVKRLGDNVSVTVFEHAVKIVTAGGETKERLAETEQISFDGSRFTGFKRIDPKRASAWRRQLLVFQDKSLAEVAAELDRYRPGKIVIMSAAVEKLPITGVFGIAETDVALQTIEQSLPVKVTRITDRLVLLSAK